MAKKCDICGKKIGLMASRLDIKDGIMCVDCSEQIGLKTGLQSISVAKDLTIDDVKSYQDSHTKIDIAKYLDDMKSKPAEPSQKDSNTKIKHPCAVCNREIGLLGGFKLTDGKICDDCASRVGLKNNFSSQSAVEYLTVQDIKNYQDTNTQIDLKKYLDDMKNKPTVSAHQDSNTKIKHPCAVCGREIGLLGGFKLTDGKICDDCASRVGLKNNFSSQSAVEYLTVQDIKNYQDTNTQIDLKKYLDDMKNKPTVSAHQDSNTKIKHPCAVCGREIGLLGGFKLTDGKICDDCASRVGLKNNFSSQSAVEYLTVQDIKNYQDTNTQIDLKKYLDDMKNKPTVSAHQDSNTKIKHPCAVCGREIGLLGGFKLTDGKICDDCASRVGLKNNFSSQSAVKYLTVQDIKNHQDSHTQIDAKQLLFDNKSEYEKLLITFKKEGNGHIGKVYLSDKRKQFLIKLSFMENLADEPFQLYDYSDLEGYDPIENGTTIEDKHGLSRAIAGGLIAGPTGAVLGAFSGNKSYAAVSKVSVVLYFKGDHRVEAVLLNETTKTDSSAYHITQQELLRFCHDLDTIIANNNSNVNEPETPVSATDSADQLRKLKGLLDDGILTEEEFTAKKKQILGI
ncbi:hypothetical protein IMAU80128_01047 [Lactiplantibacillus plantarum]|nr:hypothetical protein [Lactiplantibacillus plantarum]